MSKEMDRRYPQRAVQVAVILGLLLFLLQFVVFIVDQRELAVVLQFGNPVRQKTEPGVYFKVPFVETVRILPSTFQFWGDDASELLPDLPTRDDKKIELIPWAVWRVNDPITFVKRLRTMENAEQRVAQFTRGAMRDVITQYELADLVRSTNRELKTAQLDLASEDPVVPVEALPESLQPPKQSQSTSHFVGRQAILQKINSDARNRLAATAASEDGEQMRGIELVDLGISHIDFVDSVRMKTFERWKAEREAISTRNVTEGERLKQQILSMTKAEVERIQGDGQREASETRGRADAEVIKRYAEVSEKVGDFYFFARTLEAYEKSLSGSGTQIILTTDSDFLKTLQQANLGQATEGNGPAASPGAEEN
jgi:modulator of FtsH protease HflC